MCMIRPRSLSFRIPVVWIIFATIDVKALIEYPTNLAGLKQTSAWICKRERDQ